MTAPSENKRIVLAFSAGWVAATLFTAVAASAVPAIAAIASSAVLMALFLLSAFVYNRFTKKRGPSREEPGSAIPLSQPPSAMSLERRCELYARSRDLTPRQSEVCYLLVVGKSVNDIADELYISKDTVKTHVKSLYAKTDAHSRQELIAAVYAYEA
ncbi:MAG: helix-turn-helix transcriptional regulator [Eggerthellaceae bacterium]|nr:helix-turn-helix transcriptional regulator [Eggerthellaceae bacterium]